MKHRTLLGITDSVELGLSLQRLVQHGLPANVTFLHMTYGEQAAHLSRGLLIEVDACVIEVTRMYRGCLRAEGVSVAKRMEAARKRCLVFSFFYLGRNIETPAYWDLASSSDLSVVINGLLDPRFDWQPATEELERHFKQLLLVPEHP